MKQSELRIVLCNFRELVQSALPNWQNTKYFMHVYNDWESTSIMNTQNYSFQIRKKLFLQEHIRRQSKEGLQSLRVQEAKILVPVIFSTPFPTTRYQIKADCGEWCCYFCKFSPPFCGNRDKYCNFSVLHKEFTAFAYRIRAPPSEVWSRLPIIKFQ